MPKQPEYGGSGAPALVCRINDETNLAINALAAARGVQRSAVIRQMIEAELARAAKRGELPKEVLSEVN
jgi:predicted transcriptional regulator